MRKAMEPPESYLVTIRETLAGRKAGASAREKARLLHPGWTRSLVARLMRIKTEDRSWGNGARGESFVGWLLGRLPDGWYVFNDIPVADRGANIDHLVVGPAGVVTINTKNLSGKVRLAARALLLDGHRTDYLPKAQHEASRASKLLTAAVGKPVVVRPVLAIIADGWTVKEMPQDIHVGSPRGVKRWLLSQPPIHSASEVLAIAGAAAKPSTWRPAVAKASDRCKCGGERVPRTRRSDGAPFFGCSRFPNCRTTWVSP